MKTGIYLGKENIKIKEVEMPKVGDNDVLIKNIYSSICGTDVAVYMVLRQEKVPVKLKYFI